MRLGQGWHATAQGQDVADAGGAGFKFVDGGLIKGPSDGNARAHGRDHDDVTRHQRQVTGFVATRNEVVQVKGAHCLASALELDVAHGAIGAGAAAGEERIDQGAETRQVEGARLLCLADHIHLDTAQAPQSGVGLEVGEDFAQMALQGFFKIAHRHAS